MSYCEQLVGWVLLQCTWETLAIGLLLHVVLWGMRRSSAHKRYRCAALHLWAIIGVSLLTAVLLHSYIAGTVLGHTVPQSDRSFSAGDHQSGALRTLARVWFCGVMAMQAWVLLQFLGLRRIVRSSSEAEEQIVTAGQKISANLKLDASPEFRSADVKSPMVVGWRSTFVLLPREFHRSHPEAERMALLAHECAHVRRLDYLRNVCQLMAVSLMWWHPTVWAIYGVVRHERECVCDAEATKLNASSVPLCHALLQLAMSHVGARPLQLAAASNRVADRVLRVSDPSKYPAEIRFCRLRLHFAAVFASLAILKMLYTPCTELLSQAYAASSGSARRVLTIRAHDPAGQFVVHMFPGRVIDVVMGHQVVPPKQVIQRGDTVTVLAKSGQEILRLKINPRGGFSWKARRRSGTPS